MLGQEKKEVAPKKRKPRSTKAGINLIKMKCGDKLADVHPDEVSNFSKAGFTKV